jgi:hypothetical protein
MAWLPVRARCKACTTGCNLASSSAVAIPPAALLRHALGHWESRQHSVPGRRRAECGTFHAYLSAEPTMPAKSKDSERSSRRVEITSDTTAYEQLQGAQDRPNKRDAKMPHERDESARSTRDRLDQAPPASDSQVRRAHDDVEEGRVDTDRRGVPNDIPRSPHNRER